MPLRPGAVIGGRHRLVAELPAAEGQWRWSTDTGHEVVAPDRTAALRPGARERFARSQQDPPPAGAWLGADFAGEHDGHPVAVRPGTAAPWPDDLRLASVEAWELAAWLVPAVMAGAPQLDGQLTPADLVVLRDGSVAVGPAGLVRRVSLALPDRHQAPERAAGGGPSAASALYGLGVVLFEAVTGHSPAPGRTPEQLARNQQAPLRARMIDADVDVPLDDLLAGLLDPDPDRRLVAIAALPSVQRSPRLPLPSPSEARAPTDPHPATDQPLGTWVAVVEPSRLTARGRRNLAAFLDVDESSIDSCAAEGLPVAVASGASRTEAARAATRAEAAGLPTTLEAVGAAALGPRFALVATTAVALLGLAGVVTAAAGLGLLLLALLGVAVVLGIAAGAWWLTRRLAKGRALSTARRRLLEGARDSGLARSLSRARRSVLEADLPNQVESDLLDAADQLAEALREARTDDERASLSDRVADLERASRSAVGVAATGGAVEPEDEKLAATAAAAQAAAREVGG